MPGMKAAPALFRPGTDDMLETGGVHVWAVAARSIDPAQFLAVLDAEELDRAARFRFERHRREYVAAHWLLRRALSHYDGRAPAAWRFATERDGRPVIADAARKPNDLRFSLSHADGRALVAITRDQAVGVDLEADASLGRMGDVAPRILSPAERALWQQQPDPQQAARFALTRWTLKEAYAKARGLGLKLDFASVGFAESKGSWALSDAPADDAGARDWRFFTFAPWPDTYAALAVLAGGGAVDRRLFKITP